MIKKLEYLAKHFIKKNYEVFNYRKIPSIENNHLTLSNKALKIDAVVLFIDVRNSTKLLKKHNKTTIAKIYSIFFMTIVEIAKKNYGEVRSFNGDGALILFESGNYDNKIKKYPLLQRNKEFQTKYNAYNNAVKTALEIKHILIDEQSEVKKQINNYTDIDFGIGITTGEILCTKVGSSGMNNRDIVWISNAINKASKMSDMAAYPYNILISKNVYMKLDDKYKYIGYDPSKVMLKVESWREDCFEYNDEKKLIYKTNSSIKII